MADMGTKRTDEDRIWEIWKRWEQGRIEYGRNGEEENRGGQQNLVYMGKNRTGEDKIWEIWGRR